VDEHGLVGWALSTAEKKLAGPLPGRWQHVRGVIARAETVGERLGLATVEHEVLIAAAALHDIGLAPDVAATKASFLDGARWLAARAVPARIVDLVAHCDCGLVESTLRGYGDEYRAFNDERSPTRDALWYCCLTTAADGSATTLADRTAAWSTTYAGDGIIARYAVLARAELEGAVARTEDRLGMGGYEADASRKAPDGRPSTI